MLILLFSSLFVALFIGLLFKFLIADGDFTLLSKNGVKREEIEDKVIWITGASRGIGEVLSIQLASLGAKLIISARNEEELHRVKKLMKGKYAPDEVMVLPFDLTRGEEHLGEVVQKAESCFGGAGVDYLFHNAAYERPGTFEVNILGPISLTRLLAPHMLKRGKGHFLVVQDERSMQQLNIRVEGRLKGRCRLVKWSKPPPGWVKLNSDGSCIGNPGASGGGGVIRDDKGNLLAAYAIHLGLDTNNSAEMQGATEGLKICKEQGWRNIILETDSLLLTNWFKQNRCTPWYLWDYWDAFKTEQQGARIHINHQFREGNYIADYLAKLGSAGTNCRFWLPQQLPRLTRGQLRLDRWGLPSMRLD